MSQEAGTGQNADCEPSTAESLTAAARDVLAKAIGAHLAEYGNGIAAWKDREPPELALAQVCLQILQPVFCVPCPTDAAWERPITEDFYRCPNTGEWVYKWSDERLTLRHGPSKSAHGDDLRD